MFRSREAVQNFGKDVQNFGEEIDEMTLLDNTQSEDTGTR